MIPRTNTSIGHIDNDIFQKRPDPIQPSLAHRPKSAANATFLAPSAIHHLEPYDLQCFCFRFVVFLVFPCALAQHTHTHTRSCVCLYACTLSTNTSASAVGASEPTAYIVGCWQRASVSLWSFYVVSNL